MRTLALDCSTPACSAALFDGEEPIGARCEVLGRGHAERLVPMIAELPGKGRAQRILVSLGPGSFTGTRIGLAAARALAIAWGAQVFGFPTLALVAAMVQREHADPLTVCMTGGHGEWFVQNFAGDGLPQNEIHSLSPQAARAYPGHHLIAGSQASAMAALRDGEHLALELLPDACHALLLPGALLTSQLAPIYGRPPDARLPA